MNLAKDILHDLQEKKLVLFGVIACLAVMIIAPMELSGGGNATVVASGPAASVKTDDGPQLELTRSTTTGFARAPRVNTHQIDPFGNTPAKYKVVLAGVNKELNDVINAALAAKKEASTVAGDTTGATAPSTSGSDTPSVSGGGGGGGGGTTEPAAPTTPKVKTEKDTVLDVVVTPDDETQAKEIDDVRTLSPLPDADNPFLVYVGKTGDDTAQFIVASNATATGDGICAPSISDCSTLTLAVGQTEKFVVTTKDSSGEDVVQHISITVTDLQTKKVPVDDGTDATAAAARYEARARGIGARVVKAALAADPKVGKALIKNHVVIGG